GQSIGAGDAITWGLADVFVRAEHWPAMVETLRHGEQPSAEHVVATVMERCDIAPESASDISVAQVDRHFGQPTVAAILASLVQADDDWARGTLATLQTRSPLMMAVTLELVRRGRGLDLADDLRLERDLVHHAFHLRGPARSETVEGIRALAVDKDQAPRWQPAAVADVDPAEVAAFFASPWAPDEHPLRDLA
ncbi:MAG: enoyl-CoA hydratase/isomerase family protein, partial [Rubrivivax sp.]